MSDSSYMEEFVIELGSESHIDAIARLHDLGYGEGYRSAVDIQNDMSRGWFFLVAVTPLEQHSIDDERLVVNGSIVVGMRRWAQHWLDAAAPDDLAPVSVDVWEGHGLNAKLVALAGGIIVHPSFERRGVGEALILRSFNQAVALGCQGMLVHVWGPSQKARSLAFRQRDRITRIEVAVHHNAWQKYSLATKWRCKFCCPDPAPWCSCHCDAIEIVHDLRRFSPGPYVICAALARLYRLGFGNWMDDRGIIEEVDRGDLVLHTVPKEDFEQRDNSDAQLIVGDEVVVGLRQWYTHGTWLSRLLPDLAPISPDLWIKQGFNPSKVALARAIIVHPSLQGKGVAERLLLQSFEKEKARGAQGMVSHVWGSADSAVRLAFRKRSVPCIEIARHKNAWLRASEQLNWRCSYCNKEDGAPFRACLCEAIEVIYDLRGVRKSSVT